MSIKELKIQYENAISQNDIEKADALRAAIIQMLRKQLADMEKMMRIRLHVQECLIKMRHVCVLMRAGNILINGKFYPKWQ